MKTEPLKVTYKVDLLCILLISFVMTYIISYSKNYAYLFVINQLCSFHWHKGNSGVQYIDNGASIVFFSL